MNTVSARRTCGSIKRVHICTSESPPRRTAAADSEHPPNARALKVVTGRALQMGRRARSSTTTKASAPGPCVG